jgi:hypothetical protein
MNKKIKLVIIVAILVVIGLSIPSILSMNDTQSSKSLPNAKADSFGSICDESQLEQVMIDGGFWGEKCNLELKIAGLENTIQDPRMKFLQSLKEENSILTSWKNYYGETVGLDIMDCDFLEMQYKLLVATGLYPKEQKEFDKLKQDYRNTLRDYCS